LQKVFEKTFTKNLQNKTRGANEVQKFLIRRRAIHAHLFEQVYWFQFQATFALTLCKLVKFCTFIFALVCVGINHQKGGD
jgi:hypothetical protein